MTEEQVVLNSVELETELNKLSKAEVIERFLQLAEDQVELKKENTRLDEQAIRDRQIAKQMEGTMKITQEMTTNMGDTYKGLYDVVKESLHAGSVATEALAKLATAKPVITGNCCTGVGNCDDSNCGDGKCASGVTSDFPKPAAPGCCKDKRNLTIPLGNDPDNFDEEVETKKIQAGFDAM